MVLIAVSCMLVSILCATLLFYIVKSFWNLRAAFNIPGAFIFGAGAWLFMAWLTHDLFLGQHPPPPDVQWQSWVGYWVLAVVYYAISITISTRWLRNDGHKKSSAQDPD